MWHYMTLCDDTWRYLTSCDVMWCYMTLSDVIWRYLMLYDVIWRYMTFCDIIWRYVNYVMLCVVMWRYLTLCDIIWVKSWHYGFLTDFSLFPIWLTSPFSPLGEWTALCAPLWHTAHIHDEIFYLHAYFQTLWPDTQPGGWAGEHAWIKLIYCCTCTCCPMPVSLFFFAYSVKPK